MSCSNWQGVQGAENFGKVIGLAKQKDRSGAEKPLRKVRAASHSINNNLC